MTLHTRSVVSADAADGAVIETRGAAMVLEDAFKMVIAGVVEEAVEKAVRKVMSENGSSTASGDDRLTVTEAGALFGPAANTIRDWVSKGFITGHGKGKFMRVSRAEVKAFIDAGCPRSKDEPSDAEMVRRAEQLVRGKR